MEKLNVWCRLIASVSVISSSLSVLIPEGSIKKAFNTLMSAILVFTLIYPLNSGENFALSLNDNIDAYDFENKEIDDYSHTALIYAAENEVRKYIEKLIGECRCEIVCDYDGETVQIISISIEGEFDSEDTADYYTEIMKICGESTVIEFNGERYERKQ